MKPNTKIAEAKKPHDRLDDSVLLSDILKKISVGRDNYYLNNKLISLLMGLK